MKPQVAVIVLAAGLGRRFGAPGPKLLQPLDDQRSLLSATLEQALAADLPLKVVATPALADQACRLAAARDVLVVDEEAGEPARHRAPGIGQPGIGQSIARGVSACSDAAGWVLLPADMPLVRSSTVRAVARALAGNAVAHAQYHGRRAQPVGFSAELFTDLALLSGDEGAMRLVARYPAHAVEVDDPGVLVDVNTPDDLALARRLHREMHLVATMGK